MKKCIKCNTEKTLDSFYNRKASPDGKASYCKECTKTYKKEWREKNGREKEDRCKWSPERRQKAAQAARQQYLNNQEEYQQRARDRQNAKNKAYKEYLYTLKTPCIVCGEADPAVIDFHHLDPADKSFTIGAYCNARRPKEDIIKEVEKCVCLCANDHRRLHLGLVSLPQEHLKD